MGPEKSKTKLYLDRTLIGIDFFLVIGKEGAWLCYRKGRQR